MSEHGHNPSPPERDIVTAGQLYENSRDYMVAQNVPFLTFPRHLVVAQGYGPNTVVQLRLEPAADLRDPTKGPHTPLELPDVAFAVYDLNDDGTGESLSDEAYAKAANSGYIAPHASRRRTITVSRDGDPRNDAHASASVIDLTERRAQIERTSMVLRAGRIDMATILRVRLTHAEAQATGLEVPPKERARLWNLLESAK